MVSEPVLVTLDQKCSLGYIVTVFQPVLSSLPPALFSLVGVVSAVADLPSGFLLSSPLLVWFRPWPTFPVVSCSLLPRWCGFGRG